MDKIRRKSSISLKWSFVLYLPLCIILSFVGAFIIGISTNELQDWYSTQYYSDAEANSAMHYTITNQDGNVYYDFENESEKKYVIIYGIISYAQFFLIPLWIFICIAVTGIVFYNRELKKPIEILMNASKKISENELDFNIEYYSKNELGQLCTAFNEMRSALYDNNVMLWHSLEERKRLNSAFSHDLRTPLTVLRGYADFLQKYVPEGKVSEEKLLSVVSMMNGQIIRLEHYTQKMNAVQKLEDIVPQPSLILISKLNESLCESGGLICGEKKFVFEKNSSCENIFADNEIIMQIYENLVSNAARYAESTVKVKCNKVNDMLEISVYDDGGGFNESALKKASEPFYRDEKENDKTHFGLGLYICRILCEKCGGTLTIENYQGGGKVTAEIFCGEYNESR